MALVSLNRGSELLQVVCRVGRFAVKVLSSEQADLAATSPPRPGRTSSSASPGTLKPAFLACRVAEPVEGGDHIIVLGDVLAADSAGRLPLTYHRRVFGTHAALAKVS